MEPARIFAAGVEAARIFAAVVEAVSIAVAGVRIAAVVAGVHTSGAVRKQMAHSGQGLAASAGSFGAILPEGSPGIASAVLAFWAALQTVADILIWGRTSAAKGSAVPSAVRHTQPIAVRAGSSWVRWQLQSAAACGWGLLRLLFRRGCSPVFRVVFEAAPWGRGRARRGRWKGRGR